MLKPEPFAKRFLYATMRGCTIAVAILFLFFLVMALSVDYTPGMDFVSLATLVTFSLVISYSHGIFSIEALVPPLRFILHFTLLGIATCIVLALTTKAYFVGLLLYAVIYALTVGVGLLFRRLFKKEKPKDEKREVEYISRFSE